MLTRRDLLCTAPLILGGCKAGLPKSGGLARRDFVRRSGAGFMIGGRPYRFAGTNMWYAAYLGNTGPGGDRARLTRELDRVAVLGISNIRLLGSSELSPLKNSVRPTFRDSSARYNEELLAGLDFTFAEMGRRGQRAVIYLTNFWEWSGGMMTYLSWVNGGDYINMNDPAHPWPQFADRSSAFYANPAAVALYHDYVRSLVGRTNSITGHRYVDDPAIMSWQLANEPRPGGSDAAGKTNMPAYLGWVAATARLIKSIDPNHLVTVGSEGTQGCIDDEQCVANAHSAADVDYVTAHIWPQNWGWADLADLDGSWPATEQKVRAYFARQEAIATGLGKPLVIEEFGFPRDEARFDPTATTVSRDRFYALIYSLALDSAARGGPIAGTNFWAWGGEGRAQHPDYHFVRGDTAYLGDPPHEPQGWYSVLSGDRTTHAIIAEQARAMAALK